MSQVPSAGGELSAAPLPAQVLCRTGTGAPLRFRLAGASVIAGSDAGVGVPLPLPGVSRQHLKFVFENGSWWIEDLDSSNGTFLNGRLVTRERLRHLDVVGVGRGVEVLFLQREETPAALRGRGITHAAIVAERGPDAITNVAVGEVTLGRSSACNVQVEAAAISKIHARLERTAQVLTLRDLNSANGTFVNGERVTVAALKDGDVFSLAEVASFRVVIELGEVVSGAYAAPALTPPPEEEPAVSMDWKTRYDWDEAEMRQIAELQMKLRAQHEEAKKKIRRDTERVPAVPKAAVKPAVPPKPAPAPEPPAPPKPAPAPPPPPPPAPAASEVPETLLPGQAAAAAAAAAKLPPPIRRVTLAGAGESLVAEGAGRFEIGRGDVPLRASHPTISRRHALLLVSEHRQTLQVEDLGGRSGTFVNDAPLGGVVTLRHGDKLRLGEAVYEVRIERG